MSVEGKFLSTTMFFILFSFIVSLSQKSYK